MNHPALRLSLVLLGLLIATGSIRADDWPQWGGPLRDGVWREEGILERFPSEGPTVRWRTPIGPGFSGPAVAGGRVFVMDRGVDVDAPADLKAQWNYRDKSNGQERVLCLEEATGKSAWTYSYPCTYETAYGSGPRAVPTVCDDRVYTLGAMGDLLCLDAATGKLVWQKNLVGDFNAEVPLYGFAAAPLVDADRLIVMVGGQGQAVVALDRHTGQTRWKSGSASEPGYCAPLIRTLHGKRQLVIWHPEALMGLDPESGEVFWEVPHRVNVGMAISPPATADNALVVCSQYEGALMLEFGSATEPTIRWEASASSAPERRWKQAGFNTTMSTVLLSDGYVYGVSLYGETCCLDAADGRRVWTTLQPTSGGNEPHERWSTLFLVPHGNKVFCWNDHGDLILAKFTPAGYEEIDRAHILDPDMASAGGGGRLVVWSPPAFANRHMFVRNNQEIVCVSLQRP